MADIILVLNKINLTSFCILDNIKKEHKKTSSNHLLKSNIIIHLHLIICLSCWNSHNDSNSICVWDLYMCTAIYVPVFWVVIRAWTVFSFQMALNSGICCSQKPLSYLFLSADFQAVGVSYSAREVAENKSSPSHQYARMSRWLNFHWRPPAEFPHCLSALKLEGNTWWKRCVCSEGAS